MWELLLGVAAGTVTGLLPGIHINLVSALLFAASPFLLQYTSPFTLALFIISMSITHTFLDTIPATFLGVSDDHMLPAQALVVNGRGHEAVKLATQGSLLCLLFGIVLLPFFIWGFPKIYTSVKPAIGWVLLLLSIWLILRKERFWSAVTFGLSGLLGIVVLNAQLNEPLLPLLSGMFGTSALLLGMRTPSLPAQYHTDEIHPINMLAVTGGTLAGALIALLPGLGPAQAATMAGELFPEINPWSRIIMAGGINTANFLVSLATMFTIEKARNGSMVVVLQLLQKITVPQLLIATLACVIAGGLGTILALWFSRVFVKLLARVNYPAVCLSVLGFVVLIVTVFSGWRGLLILVISTAIGLIPQLTNAPKQHCMGCLIVPVMLFFL
ncbi:MAG: tripartite tricarboxylate transporter permease [Nanoarchaeota archaeon]